jgi:HlyD family secretion protein
VNPTRTLALIAGSLLAAGAFAGPAPAQTAARPAQPAASGQVKPPSITVTRVERAEVAATTLVSGNIVARDEVLVVPEVDGLSVQEILAEEGDRVAARQVLLRLNRAQLDVALAQNAANLQRVAASIGQVRAQIAEAEANRAQAVSAFARSQTLRGEGITSADAFEQRQAAARSAEARLASARQALMIAEAEQASTEAQRRDIDLRLERSEIRAPRAGVISRRSARLGAIASAASPEPLFRIIADGAVELEAEVPEADMPRLAVGKPVQVTPAGMTSPIVGAIRLISPEVDRQSRLGRVRIALPQASASAVGSFARGLIEIDRRTGLTVPLSALTYRRDGATVLVVENDVVHIRRVTIGLTGNNRVELIDGVKDGDVIVARAGTFLREGDMITPVAAPLAAGAQARAAAN